MSPVRIVILGLLFFLLYKLLFPAKRREQPVQPPSRPQEPGAPEVLREDPVCHTYIPEGQAETLYSDGTTYYFCSIECKEKFSQENRS